MKDKGLAWELTKMEITSFTLPYCIKKKKLKIAFKTFLEQELIILQEMLDSNPTQQNQEYFEANKSELEKIEKDEMNSYMFRSKIKWTEDGEKKLKILSGFRKT